MQRQAELLLHAQQLLSEIHSTHSTANDEAVSNWERALDIEDAAKDLIHLVENGGVPDLPQTLPENAEEVVALFEQIQGESDTFVANPQRILQQAQSIWNAAKQVEMFCLENGILEDHRSLAETETMGPTSANMRPSSIPGSQLQDATYFDLDEGSRYDVLTLLYWLQVIAEQRLEDYCVSWKAGHKVCPWTHELKIDLARNSWSCEICSQNFPENTYHLRCQECNWDVCMICSEQHSQKVKGAEVLEQLEELTNAILKAIVNANAFAHNASDSGQGNSGIVGCIAFLLQQRQETKEIRILEQMLLLQALVGVGNPSPSVAFFLRELGRVKMNLDQWQAAESLFQESLDIQRAVPGWERSQSVAVTLHELGLVKRELGDLQGADSLFQKSLAIVPGWDGSPSVAATLYMLGMVKRELRDLHGADSLFQKSLAIQRAVPGWDGSPSVEGTLYLLGMVKRELGDLQAADSLLQESLDIQCAVPGWERSLSVAVTLHELGMVKRKLGLLQAADSSFRKSLDIQRAVPGWDGSPSVVGTLYLLGMVKRELGDLQAADSLLRESLDIQFPGWERSLSVAVTLHELGMVKREGLLQAADS